MTQHEFSEKIIAMLDKGPGIKQVIYDACMSAVSSPYGKEQFLDQTGTFIPRAALSAVFSELARKHEPVLEEDAMFVKQISNWIDID